MESRLLFGPPHYFQVLNPNAARGKGGLPSVVTHLNAKDAFLPSSLSFFTLISLASSISPTLFSFYCLIISSLSLSLHLQSNFCPASPPLFFFPLAQLHLVFLCPDPQWRLESKNHLRHLRLTCLPSTVHHPQGFQVINSTLKIEINGTIACELMKLYLTNYSASG